MRIMTIGFLLGIFCLVSLCCFSSPDSASDEVPAELSPKIASRMVEPFTKPKKVEANLEKALTALGVPVNDVKYRDNIVSIWIEQPANLMDAHVEFLYLSVFTVASHMAPLSEQVIIIVEIDGELFIQMTLKTQDIKVHNRAEIDQQELFGRMRLSVP